MRWTGSTVPQGAFAAAGLSEEAANGLARAPLKASASEMATAWDDAVCEMISAYLNLLANSR